MHLDTSALAYVVENAHRQKINRKYDFQTVLIKCSRKQRANTLATFEFLLTRLRNSSLELSFIRLRKICTQQFLHIIFRDNSGALKIGSIEWRAARGNRSLCARNKAYRHYVSPLFAYLLTQLCPRARAPLKKFLSPTTSESWLLPVRERQRSTLGGGLLCK